MEQKYFISQPYRVSSYLPRDIRIKNDHYLGLYAVISTQKYEHCVQLFIIIDTLDTYLKPPETSF